MHRTYPLRALLAAVLIATLWTGEALARSIHFSAEVGEPVILEGAPRTSYLKIRVEGEALEGADRAPANVAIVIDKSGSMRGEKLAHAKQAALMAIDELDARDIVSVVLYDSTVDVLVPATKASDRQAVRERLYAVMPGGQTALFGGVSKAAAELRKFLDMDRVNRMVVLSDGLANVGPQSPCELGALGATLEKQGISVTTIGLGLDYNEDLMANLARQSHGSHIFAENPADLENAFAREFGDVLTAVAQDARVTVTCPEGVRPVRIIGREGTINGRQVTLDLGQVYGKQVKYAIVELEVPKGTTGESRSVASAEVQCYGLQTGTEERYKAEASVTFTDNPSEVEAHRDSRTMVSVVRQLAAENTALARELRDEGKVSEARDTLKLNGKLIMEWNGQLQSPALQEDLLSNSADMRNLSEEDWKQRRKVMVDKEIANQLQSLGYAD
jgi:Ca-activated chloride channel family protein